MPYRIEVKIAIIAVLLSLIPTGFGMYLNLTGRASWIMLPFVVMDVIITVYFTWKADEKEKVNKCQDTKPI